MSMSPGLGAPSATYATALHAATGSRRRNDRDASMEPPRLHVSPSGKRYSLLVLVRAPRDQVADAAADAVPGEVHQLGQVAVAQLDARLSVHVDPRLAGPTLHAGDGVPLR